MLEKIRKLSKKYGEISLDWFDDDSGSLYYDEYPDGYQETYELFDFTSVDEFITNLEEEYKRTSWRTGKLIKKNISSTRTNFN